jgi:hypothetical protein
VIAGKPSIGPWRVGETHNGEIAIKGGNGSNFTIASVDAMYGTVAQAEANARLIAAAPDLLEACKEALDLLGRDGYSVQQLLMAIAKAEGNQP